MGLVQNLKKKLGRWTEKILVELSYHYVIQRAKQTSRKPDNSLRTESLRNNLTMGHQSTIIATSSQGTSEKTIMEQKTTEDIVAHVRDWSMDKIDSDIPMENAKALHEEFEEWIEIDDVDELEIVSLEHIEEYLKD